MANADKSRLRQIALKFCKHVKNPNHMDLEAKEVKHNSHISKIRA